MNQSASPSSAFSAIGAIFGASVLVVRAMLVIAYLLRVGGFVASWHWRFVVGLRPCSSQQEDAFLLVGISAREHGDAGLVVARVGRRHAGGDEQELPGAHLELP